MNRYLQYMYSYPHKTAYRTLENVDVRDYFFNLGGEGHSLYLHLPFCESKCGYCNLFSVTGCSRIQMDSYLEAVLRQMKQYRQWLPQDASFGDFTIGGGTPLLLEGAQIERVFEAVETCMPMASHRKVIIETAPNQTDRENVGLLKSLGVTRVSMGIQSFDDGELKWLGRNHSSARAGEAAGLLAEAGFECVNFDFIYGLPGQTAGSLTDSLRRALAFWPDEIFLYPLYIKHGAGLERRGRKRLLDSDHTYALYQCGAGYLKENGYVQMSMRRFLRNGRRNEGFVEMPFPEFCECGLKSALSLGCGGRSYLGRLHTCTPYQTTRSAALEEIERFQRREDFSRVTNGILLSEEELKRRYVIKHLLILPGISGEAYKRLFHSELLEDFPMIADWIRKGWLREGRMAVSSGSADGPCAAGNGAEWAPCAAGDESVLAPRAAAGDENVLMSGVGSGVAGCIGLTEEGLGLSDYIGPQLISEDIRRKMLEWEKTNG